MILSIKNVDAGYGRYNVLDDVSIEAEEGQIISILGANGAGKTTLVRTVSGLIRPTSGSISFDGRVISSSPPHEIARQGVIQVPEGRELFGGLSVRENLEMGGYGKSRAERVTLLHEVAELFPLLAERASQHARNLSGGQQQMLAIGRALMARPRLLILDEPSLGLAPILVEEVLQTVEQIGRSGITVILVEQHAARAIQLADRVFVLENGRVALTGDDVLDNEELRRTYLGL